ncbi:hypothetical protein AYL99_06844 [Fonsecaea erecta]|uniref:GH16 domain-containing protein n=1 Tax=Fonsecaea erecta TaxID=1367422 RepID=A0A178ZJH1_9EURO|nr:hypothetical protein AYL99_06844 [Fonsecaea erecta]OAP59546.1 hypothetical protein AYL99_06844 [Fonsecaea erecta]
MGWEDYYTLLEDVTIFIAILQRLGSSLHMLHSRQSSPPITTDPDCTQYDGYFYVTPRNYTWQLQCASTYDGTIIAQTTDATDLGSCIEECVNYNHQNTPGSCLAVTFNGAYDTADTVCTQFSDVAAVNIASEEGGRYTQHPAPISVETVERRPRGTTVTLLSFCFANFDGEMEKSLQQTRAIVLWRANPRTDCGSSPYLEHNNPSCGHYNKHPSIDIEFPNREHFICCAHHYNYFYCISDGGSRPATSVAPASTTSTTGAFTFDSGQTTLTNVVPFTEYRLQLIEVCAATPAPCSQSTSSCPPIPGLATSEYFMDFSQQTTTPSDWILADYATVGYGSPNGANFTFAKRYDAPYIWTRFYVLFGRIEVVVQAAPGAGIITSSVMMSDDLDEIDWEWSGNNFAGSSGAVQTNYFGKGQVGNSDRGSQPAVNDPEHNFHTYALDWQPDKLIWSIDGVAVRTLNNNGATTGSYQYPQTPSRLHLGLWCSGDPSTPYGTVYWGGGYTNFSAAPFSAYVKSVKITTNNMCSSWQYSSPFDGTYQSVQCTNQTLALPCSYTVVAGDDGSSIAKNLTVNFDTLQAANPGVNWDQLLVGQVLIVPGGTCPTSTTASTPSSTSLTSTMSSTTASSSSPPDNSSLSILTSASSAYTSSSSSSTTSSSTTTPVPSTSTSLSTTTSSAGSPSYSSTALSASGAPSTTTSTQASSDQFSANTATSTSALTTTTSTTSTSLASIVSTTTGIGSTTTTSPAPSQAANTYTVVAGDFGWAIASSLGCSWDALNGANPGVDWDNLQVGQTLNIPTQATGSSTPTTASSSVSASGSTSTGLSDTSDPDSNSNSDSECDSDTTCGGQLGNQPSSPQPNPATSTLLTTTCISSRSSCAASSAIIASATTSATPSDSDSDPDSLAASSSASTTVSGAAVSTSIVSTAGTSSSNAVNPVTTPPPSASKLVCNQDNCLRNLIDPRYSSAMRRFCAGYTTTASNTAPLPTFLGGCSANVKRVLWNGDSHFRNSGNDGTTVACWEPFLEADSFLEIKAVAFALEQTSTYPAAKTRKYEWSEKAKRRKTTGTGRMRSLKLVARVGKHADEGLQKRWTGAFVAEKPGLDERCLKSKIRTNQVFCVQEGEQRIPDRRAQGCSWALKGMNGPTR